MTGTASRGMADPSTEPLLHALLQARVPGIDGACRSAHLLAGSTLHLSSAQPRYAHFLRSGATSTSLRTTDGRCAAIRMNGRGAVLEIYQLLGVPVPEGRVTVLVPGDAVRVPFGLVRRAFLQDSRFRECVLSWLGVHSLETEQIALCNRLHQLEPRLARFLLSVQDCCGDATIPMTQESLSDELGVQRSSVALAAGALRRTGMLAFRRGRIQILDRARLEGLACECYGAIRRLRSLNLTSFVASAEEDLSADGKQRHAGAAPAADQPAYGDLRPSPDKGAQASF